MSMEKIAEEKKELVRYLTKVAAARIIEDEMLKAWMKAANEDEEKTASSEQNEAVAYLAQIGQAVLQKQAQDQAAAQLLVELQKQASAQQTPAPAATPQEQLVALVKAAALEQEQLKKEAVNKNLLKLLGALGIGGAAGYGASQYGDELGDLMGNLGGGGGEEGSSSAISDLISSLGGGMGSAAGGSGIASALSSILPSFGGGGEGGGIEDILGSMGGGQQGGSAALPKEFQGLDLSSIPNLV